MAKSAGAATKSTVQTDIVPEDQEAASSKSGTGAAVTSGKATAKSGPATAANDGAPVDLNSFAKARDALEQQLKFWTLAIEDTNRSWRQFDDQVASTGSELLRLRETDKQFQSLSLAHGDLTRQADAQRTELADLRIREAAASEKAAKLEDICEQIKERALEIHNALQASRANEQKLQAEVTRFQSELVELRRAVQEEEAGRLAAEERAGKLQAMVTELDSVEAEARSRVAKLTDENKIMSQQLPQLLADSNSWQKQFSASERENTRMQSERRVSSERISELEAEIKTLRADLASLVKKPEAEPAVEETVDIDVDELDLVSTLDKAFAGGDESDYRDNNKN